MFKHSTKNRRGCEIETPVRDRAASDLGERSKWPSLYALLDLQDEVEARVDEMRFEDDYRHAGFVATHDSRFSNHV